MGSICLLTCHATCIWCRHGVTVVNVWWQERLIMIKTLYSTLCKCEHKCCNAGSTCQCIPNYVRVQFMMCHNNKFSASPYIIVHIIWKPILCLYIWHLRLYILQLSRARNLIFFVNSHTFTNYFLSFTGLPYYNVHKYNMFSELWLRQSGLTVQRESYS